MITTLTSMLVFAMVGACTPGPVNLIATGSGALYGYRQTLPHILGATVAYTMIVLLSGLALESLAQLLPRITWMIKLAGSVFLLMMAYKIARAEPATSSNNQHSQPPSLTQGALSQYLNPKAWLVALSGASVFVVNQGPLQLYLVAFCLISFAACFTGISLWAATGEWIGRYLHNVEHQRCFNRLMASLLCATVLSMLLS